jgi:hypothetical protein
VNIIYSCVFMRSGLLHIKGTRPLDQTINMSTGELLDQAGPQAEFLTGSCGAKRSQGLTYFSGTSTL